MKLYLDIDGVLSPYPSMGKMGDWPDYQNYEIDTYDLIAGPPEKYTLRLSGAMGERLGALATKVDIVWNSTWCMQTGITDIAEIMSLPGAHVSNFLELGIWNTLDDPEHVWYDKCKLETILQDQTKKPEPFVWIDDESITYKSAIRLEDDMIAPYRLIRPNSKVGLTAKDFDEIEEWFAIQKDWQTGYELKV